MHGAGIRVSDRRLPRVRYDAPRAMLLPEIGLRTARMTLRPLRAGDCDQFVHMHRISWDFHAPWLPSLHADDTLESLFEKQLRRTIDGLASGRDLRLAGFLDDGRIAG